MRCYIIRAPGWSLDVGFDWPMQDLKKGMTFFSDPVATFEGEGKTDINKQTGWKHMNDITLSCDPSDDTTPYAISAVKVKKDVGGWVLGNGKFDFHSLCALPDDGGMDLEHEFFEYDTRQDPVKQPYMDKETNKSRGLYTAAHSGLEANCVDGGAMNQIEFGMKVWMCNRLLL